MTDDEYIQSLCLRAIAAPEGTIEFEAAIGALHQALAESTGRVREKIESFRLAVQFEKAADKQAA